MAVLHTESPFDISREIEITYHNSGLSRNDIKANIDAWAKEHGIECSCTGEMTGSNAAGITHSVYYRVPDPVMRTFFKLRWA